MVPDSWGEGEGFIDIVTLRHYLPVDVSAQVAILLPHSSVYTVTAEKVIRFTRQERIDTSARPNNFRRNADVPEKNEVSNPVPQVYTIYDTTTKNSCTRQLMLYGQNCTPDRSYDSTLLLFFCYFLWLFPFCVPFCIPAFQRSSVPAFTVTHFHDWLMCLAKLIPTEFYTNAMHLPLA